MHRLGVLIRKRRAKHVSLRAAAVWARVSYATLSRVERGGIPDLMTFLKICQWLSIPPHPRLVRKRQGPRS